MAIALYILACAVISLIAAVLLPDYTNRDMVGGATTPQPRHRNLGA